MGLASQDHILAKHYLLNKKLIFSELEKNVELYILSSFAKVKNYLQTEYQILKHISTSRSMAYCLTRNH